MVYEFYDDESFLALFQGQQKTNYSIEVFVLLAQKKYLFSP